MNITRKLVAALILGYQPEAQAKRDAEAAKAAAKEAAWQAYRKLNNLYLDIQRGRVRLTITNANELRVLAGKAYDRDDPMLEWWAGEFIKLPRWNDV